MFTPSVGQIIATAVLVGLVLWGKFSWDTYEAMKTATLRTELEKKVREELKAEAAAETAALEERKAFERDMKKKAREELETEAAAAMESEKKVREKLEAEVAAAMESEKRVREKLKAEAGAEITALEKQRLFESGMAYCTLDVYEKGMSNGRIIGRNRALAAQVWALGTVHGEGPRQGDNTGPDSINNGHEPPHNVGPETFHIVNYEPLHNAGSEDDHTAKPRRGKNARAERSRSAGHEPPQNNRLERDHNADLGRGRNAGPRHGHGSRRARRAPSSESSEDGEEEYHGSHR